MNVSYRIHDETQEIYVQDEDDLKILFENIETELRARHAEVDQNPDVLVIIATGLLNALADNQDEIVLGELSGSD